MMKNMKRLLQTVLAAWGAFVAWGADTLPVQDTFENGTLDSTLWSGDGTISNLTYTYTQAIGLPVTGEGITHAKVLYVEGTSTRKYDDAASAKRTVDLMVMAEDLPDEEIPEASGDEQFRVAFGTNGCLNLFHYDDSIAKPASNWTEITTTSYPSGTWVRVTLNIVYPSDPAARAVAQVLVDGSPCVTTNGYREAACTNRKGSWYKSAIAGTKIAQVEFTGIGGVDDLVLANTESVTPPASSVKTNGVDYSWMIDNGIAAEDLDKKATTESAYTAKQSFDAGLDPYSATPLYVSNAVANATTVTLRLNGYNGSYKLLKSATAKGTATEVTEATIAADTTAKDTTVAFDLPTSDAVAYYTVQTTSGSVTATNKFGISKITSSDANTIVSAPWISLGLNDTAMNVADLVMTNNLTMDDQLILFDGSAYQSWILTTAGWTGQAISDTSSALPKATAGAATTTLARGQGIWLVRQHPMKDGVAVPFYLFGQHTDTAAKTTVTVADDATKPKTVLLANPDPTSSKSMSALLGTSTDSEVIMTGSSIPKVYTYSSADNTWAYDKTTVTKIGGINVQTKTRSTDGNAISAGQGFWLRTKSDKTINW